MSTRVRLLSAPAPRALPLFTVLLTLLVILSGCALPNLDSLGRLFSEPKPVDYCANFASKDDCYLQFAQENSAPEFCKKVVDSVKSEQCLLGLAISGKEKAFCKVYSGKPDQCLYDFALTLSLPDICVEIATPSLSDSCYTALGAKLSDSRVCLQAVSQQGKSACLYAVAQRTLAPAACTEIFDESLRHKCLFEISSRLSNPALCDQFEVAFAFDDCWQGMAVLKKDPRLCDKLKDGTLRDECYLAVGEVSGEILGLKNSLAQLCAKLATEAQQQACRERLAAYKLGKDFCDDVESVEVKAACLDTLLSFYVEAGLCPKYQGRAAVDGCYERIALLKSSLPTCKLIVDVPQELSCIYKLAVKEKNPKYCAETHVTDSFDYRNECYKEVALLAHNPRACDSIYFREKRASCRADIAAVDQNYTLCKEIENEPLSESTDPFFTRDHCFLALNQLLRDPALCDLIEEASRKQACKDRAPA